MGIFGNLKSDGLEETRDSLGGSYTLDTGIYDATIKAAYAGKSAGGANSLTILATINGRDYSETLWVTNKKGENWFLNKQDNTKKVPLPGFTVADDLCLCTVGMELSEMNTEDKVFKIWDYDARAEVPKSVPMLVDLVGQVVTVAIVRQTVDKNVKDSSGNYVPTGDTRDENLIDKVFNTETKMTVAEARQGATEAAFHDAWSERNKGKTRDKTSKNDNNSGTAGRPMAANSNSAAPQPGAAAGGARKSLFGK